jgi:Uma2 family endonuclease
MTALLEPPVTRGDVHLPLFRVDLAHYDRMVSAGVFDDKNVELLDGLILEREPIKPAHYTRVKRMYDRLLVQFSNLATVYSKVPLELPKDGRPQPDIMLTHLGAGETSYTQPEEVYLLLEIADTSLERDREFKSHLYARDGVLEYWILNLQKINSRFTAIQKMVGTTSLWCLRLAKKFLVWHFQPSRLIGLNGLVLQWRS